MVKETKMMKKRWKVYEFTHEIPQEEIKEVKPWSQTRTQGHLWGTTKMQDPARRSKAMVAISAACLFPFFTGKPEATM